MAKYVFKPVEISKLGRPIVIDLPKIESKKEEVEIIEVKEEEKGPTVEEVEAEIEQKRYEFDEQLAERRENFQYELEEIKKNAEQWAFDKIKEADDEYGNKISAAKDQNEKIINDANKQAKLLIDEAEKKASQVEMDAYKSGFEEGRDEGFQTGKEEVDRLIERLKIILSSAITKRNEIIEEAEAQIVDIVLSIARKIVKIITEENKMVVVENIKDSLRKLKGRAEITIKINTEDLQMTTKYKNDFISMMETIDHVRILEDNTVERGGCIISTDFGSIDARISSQLSEIESKIREISPTSEETI